MSNILCFPADLRELDTTSKAYPKVAFTVQTSPADGKMFKTVYLPMPSSIGFTDSGEYSSMELGPLAASGLQDSLSSLLHGDVRGASKGAGGTLTQIKNLKFMEVASIFAQKIPYVGTAGKEKAMFAQKKVMAPNTNTTFKSNAIREFSFSFSMIATTKEDTAVMQEIHTHFRRYAYAGADSASPNIILDYPPIWKVQFILDGDDNPYLPKIFGCYLKSIASTFNPNASLFRTDGSPHEIQMQLSFGETRVLTRADIDGLENGQSNRGIDEKTGLSTSASSVTTTGSGAISKTIGFVSSAKPIIA